MNERAIKAFVPEEPEKLVSFFYALAGTTATAMRVETDDVSVTQVFVGLSINASDIEVWGFARKTPERLPLLNGWRDSLAKVITSLAQDSILASSFEELSTEVFVTLPDAEWGRTEK